MALVGQVLFDRYETALLIEAWLNVQSGKMKRNEAVSSLSKTLRARAVKNGMEIDDAFRTESGLSGQLNKVQRLMLHQPNARQHNTKLIVDMVDLYFNDRRRFEEILQIAKGGGSPMKTEEEQFADWLSAHVSPHRLSDYFMAMTEVESLARKKRIIGGSVYDIRDAAVISEILRAIQTDRFFRFTHRKQLRHIQEAAQLFQRYTQENRKPIESAAPGWAQRDFPPHATAEPAARGEEIQGHPAEAVPASGHGDSPAPADGNHTEIHPEFHPEFHPEIHPEIHPEKETPPSSDAIQETQTLPETQALPETQPLPETQALPETKTPPADAEDGQCLLVDFTRDTDFAFTKPISVSYFGDVFYETSWRKLYVRVCRILWEDYPGEFRALRAASASGDRRSPIYDEAAAKRLTSPARIAEGYYIETQRSASDLIYNIKTLLDCCRVDDENLEIRYRKLAAPPVTAGPSAPPGEGAAPKREPPRAPSGIKDARAGFANWLLKQGYTHQTANGYAYAVSAVDQYATTHGFSKESLFLISDGEVIKDIWARLRADASFAAYNRDKHNQLAASFRQYIAYRSGPIPARSRSSLPEKHPCQAAFEAWLTEMGTPNGSVATYSDGVKRAGDYLLKTKQEYRPIYSIFGVSRLEHIRETLQRDPVYAEKVGRVNVSMHCHALRKYIAFRKNDTGENREGEFRGRFQTLLKERFENGFRVNSLIDRNRLKQYYAEAFGEEIPLPDETIVETIKQLGEVREDRVYVRDGYQRAEVLDAIQADIAEAFGTGATCVYIGAVFEKYQRELASPLQIFSEESLRERLLATCYGAYQASRDFFYVRGRTPDAASDVRKVLKESSLPMTYDQMRSVLWYLPIEQIKRCLVAADDLVQVAQETYFYAYNLPVSPAELERIAALVHAQLMQKPFITDGELRTLITQHCPSVAINTESFSTWGLRNALAVLLRDRFSFRGTIISERGQEINVAQAFETFCEAREEMSLEELREFAKEMNAPIHWESVFRKMLRVSSTRFLSRGKVEFDVPGVDAVLDRLIEGDYVPLKAFSLFLHFPAASVPWNEYVLEGYAALYSRDFTLLHTSYSATECSGAIVRKSSPIRDFPALVTDVLARSDAWRTQADALALLVREGYLRVRRYGEIDSVMADARRRRERAAGTGAAGR